MYQKSSTNSSKTYEKVFSNIDHIILKLSFPPNEYKLKSQAISRIVKDIEHWVLLSHKWYTYLLVQVL